MNNQNKSPIGGDWLCQKFGLAVVNPLAVLSAIGSRRHTIASPAGTRETYQESMRPPSTLRGHLTFHLKHEPINLEMLSRLFAVTDANELNTWVASEPSSQYAKRVGFLYEWLTGRQLALDQMIGNNVDALDADSVIVAAQSSINRRWKVRDNMPGTREFCPLVRRTAEAKRAMAFNCGEALADITAEFGADMLLKSAVWLTLRESKASFQIEGEADQLSRIQRFADTIHRHTGNGEIPLSQTGLALLQGAILGERASIAVPGIRRSPVFVGQSIRYDNVVHYVAPPHTELSAMLYGLTEFLARTVGLSPVMRSAVAAFGFIYIHPLADGNGRVHRFLINDLLRRDGAVNAPVILPVSALLTRDAVERKAYDDILDLFSKPFMQNYREACRFSDKATKYEDQITSNFTFDASAEAMHAWRYIDLTAHVTFTAALLEKTIHQELRAEAQHLRQHTAARSAILDIIEMPNHHVDRVIRSIEQNGKKLSGVLAQEIPALLVGKTWERVFSAVKKHLL